MELRQTFGRISLVEQMGVSGWLIQAEPWVMMRLRRLLPRAKPTIDGRLLVSRTPEVGRDIEWLMARWPLEADPATMADLTGHADRDRQREDTIRAIHAGTYQRQGIVRTPARPPRSYQQEAADLVLATGNLLVVHAVGLGKTYTGYLGLADDITLPAAVFTLGGTMPQQWLDQLALIWPDLHGVVLRSGPMYDPAQRLKRDRRREPDVFVLPYSRATKWQDYLRGRVRTVIFDEIQELRHPDSAKYAACVSIAHAADYRVGLSATPIYGYGGETYDVTEAIAPGRLGTRQEFLREWGGHQAGSVATNYTIEQISPLALWMVDQGLMHLKTRKDVGREIPDPIRVEQEVDVSDNTIIEQTVRDCAEFARTILEPGRGIDKMKASSELDFRMREATGLAKAPHVAALCRLLLESENKIVLFGWHHAVYKVWRDLLADFHPVFYTGSESETQKKAAIAAFVNGPSRIMVMSLRAGAGIDGLQEVADVAVFGELDWSPAVLTQDIGRIARDHLDGRVKSEPCTAYIVTCTEGSDPSMLDVLGVKTQQSRGLTDPRNTGVEAVADNSDRIRRLAAAVLGRPAPDTDSLAQQEKAS